MSSELWKDSTLGELFEIVTGTTPSKSKAEFYGDFMPLIKPPELHGGSIEKSTDGLSELGSKQARILPPDSVLVSCIGNLGKLGMNSSPVAFNQQINAIKPNYEIAIPKFVFYYCMSNKFREQLHYLASGTTVSLVNKTKFKSIKISLPSLNEQQRIVSILDEVFENISNSSKRVEQKLLDTNELFQSVIHTIITLDGHSWDEFALDELTHKITKGSSPKWQGVSYIDEPGVLFVTSENVGNNQMIYKKTKFVEDKFNEIDSKSILQKGDVLTNIVGASIGRTAVFDKHDNANINQAVCLIRCKKEKLVNKYLAYLLNSHSFKQILHDNEVNTARANLSLGFFRSLVIPVPTISEQYEIVEQLEEIADNYEKLLNNYSDEMKEIDELKQSILQEAFNGNLTKEITA